MPLALPSRWRKAWVCPAQRGPCFRAALRRQSPPLSPPAASHATQCSPRPRSQDVLDSPEGLPLPTRHPVSHRPVPLHCWLADNGVWGGGYGGMVQITIIGGGVDRGPWEPWRGSILFQSLLAPCLAGIECSENTGELLRLWTQASISNPSLPFSLPCDLRQVSYLLCTTPTCSVSKMGRMILSFYGKVRPLGPVQCHAADSVPSSGHEPFPLVWSLSAS